MPVSTRRTLVSRTREAPQAQAGPEDARLSKDRDLAGAELDPTEDRGRRWYHLRPKPRRRTDLSGFNSAWWMAQLRVAQRGALLGGGGVLAKPHGLALRHQAAEPAVLSRRNDASMRSCRPRSCAKGGRAHRRRGDDHLRRLVLGAPRRRPRLAARTRRRGSHAHRDTWQPRAHVLPRRRARAACGWRSVADPSTTSACARPPQFVDHCGHANSSWRTNRIPESDLQRVERIC
jgi:hypothetical protein